MVTLYDFIFKFNRANLCNVTNSGKGSMILTSIVTPQDFDLVREIKVQQLSVLVFSYFTTSVIFGT